MSNEPRDEHVWEEGWEGHSRAQQERLARLSLIEKIRWLEEAQVVAERLGRKPEKRADHDRSAPG